MKTVVIRSMANGLRRANQVQYDANGKVVYLTPPLTQLEIDNYKKSLPQLKQETYKAIKPMLTSGGFLFDSSLWGWEWRQPDKNQYELWFTMTFVDDNNEGKTAFMNAIKQTGILNYDFDIIKPYS